MPKFVLSGHIVVPDVDLPAVLAELPTHIHLTRREHGCLRFDVTQSPDVENVFLVYEEFIDRVAFESHQQRVKSSDWGRVAENVQRHYRVMEAD